MVNFLERIPLFREKKCHIEIEVDKLLIDEPKYVGPFLNFNNCKNDIWTGTLMYLSKINQEITDPVFELDCVETEKVTIGQENNYIFTKWNISIPQFETEKRINYSVNFDKINSHCFFIAGKSQTWKMSFYSCNGLSHTSGYAGYAEKYGVTLPLWCDLIHHHHDHKYHLLIGLGDQIYSDEVWEHVEDLSKWTFFKDRKERENMACPEKLKQDVDKWSMFHYMYHTSQPYYAQALANIPNLNVSSDHDFVDGLGSYPEDLEKSPVFSAVRKILEKYYLLFQCHQDPDAYFNSTTEIYGDSVAPFVKQLGQDLAILGLDTRFERTRKRIIKPETYDYIFKLLAEETNLKTKHLLVATEIPLIFPDLRGPERILQSISNLKRKEWYYLLFRQVRLFKILGLPFGEPLLLTDMIDHWNSDAHIKERNEFIWKLQDFSKEKSIRVTFLSGDVHCCGIGRLATPSDSKDKIRDLYKDRMIIPINFQKDHRLMYQIISSAIANVPPPSYVVKFYHLFDKSEKIKKNEKSIDEEITDGRMLRFFMRDTKGKVFGRKAKKLLGKRNWASVEMSSIDNSLFFQLYVEMFLGAGKTVKYNIVVPSLDLDK